jgi:hypothetical protein
MRPKTEGIDEIITILRIVDFAPRCRIASAFGAGAGDE